MKNHGVVLTFQFNTEFFWWILILILGFQIRKSWCIRVHSNYRNIETWNDLPERFSDDIMSTTDLNISSNTSQPYITSLHTSPFLSNVLFWLPHENISQAISFWLFKSFLPSVPFKGFIMLSKVGSTGNNSKIWVKSEERYYLQNEL